eukprot:1348150-Amphidinium_carterae.1
MSHCQDFHPQLLSVSEGDLQSKVRGVYGVSCGGSTSYGPECGHWQAKGGHHAHKTLEVLKVQDVERHSSQTLKVLSLSINMLHLALGHQTPRQSRISKLKDILEV